MKKSIYKILAFLMVVLVVLTSCQTAPKADENKTANNVSETPKEENKTSNAAEKPAETAVTEDTFPVTIKHNSGETVLETKPMRIVAADFAVLDVLDSLGLKDRVVGTFSKNLPESLKHYSDVESVGALKELDLEAIAKLKPDVVFIGNRLAKHYAEFAPLFTTIDASVSWNNIPEGKTYSQLVLDNIRNIAKAVGESAKGEEVANKLAAVMEEYKDLAKGKGKALVLMSNGGEISMHGPASRWAPLFDIFGFENVDIEKSDEGHKGQKISFETVQSINPDWIFVVDRDAAVGRGEAGQTAQAVMDNDLVKATNAYKNGQIVYLTPAPWYIIMTGANNYEYMLNEVAAPLKK